MSSIRSFRSASNVVTRSPSAWRDGIAHVADGAHGAPCPAGVEADEARGRRWPGRVLTRLAGEADVAGGRGGRGLGECGRDPRQRRTRPAERRTCAMRGQTTAGRGTKRRLDLAASASASAVVPMWGLRRAGPYRRPSRTVVAGRGHAGGPARRVRPVLPAVRWFRSESPHRPVDQIRKPPRRGVPPDRGHPSR